MLFYLRSLNRLVDEQAAKAPGRSEMFFINFLKKSSILANFFCSEGSCFAMSGEEKMF